MEQLLRTRTTLETETVLAFKHSMRGSIPEVELKHSDKQWILSLKQKIVGYCTFCTTPVSNVLGLCNLGIHLIFS